MNKKSALVVSGAVILLCMAVIVGMTWALFSDSLTVHNHLQAGHMKIFLYRTDLEYCTLNDEGVLTTTNVPDDLNLSTPTTDNVFGIDSNSITIVPGSYFDAELELRKNSTVAFDYSIEIQLVGEVNDLAEQMQLEITPEGGSTTTVKLSELGSAMTIKAGTMGLTDTVQKFNVCVTFVGDSDNNDAMNQAVSFDLLVKAEQATN